jgi:exonuclease III
MRAKTDSPTLSIVSWNMHQSMDTWDYLLNDSSLDVALVQEAVKPQKKILWSTPDMNDLWRMQGYNKKFCAAVVGLSTRITGKPLATRRLGDEGKGLVVSRPGTLAAAEVITAKGEEINVISVYANWEYIYDKKHTMFADASCHRLISDLSALVYSEKNHKVIVAGDWNIFFGYGDKGSLYWKARYNTVFTRMEALGLKFAGPQYPGGIQADPWPPYLPPNSKNVPTFRKRLDDPASATDQLDFVFASNNLYSRMNVRALNSLEQWGPSDHCRVRIDLS